MTQQLKQLQFEIAVDLMHLLEAESHIEAIAHLNDEIEVMLYEQIRRNINAMAREEALPSDLAHEFTFLYRLPQGRHNLDALQVQLDYAGCADALATFGVEAVLSLAFVRSAKTREAAMHSAFDDVQRAFPGAALLSKYERHPDQAL